MIDAQTSSRAPHSRANADLRCDAKPYAPPVLEELGAIGAVTAGPNDGTLDQLGGASGGFLVANGTS